MNYHRKCSLSLFWAFSTKPYCGVCIVCWRAAILMDGDYVFSEICSQYSYLFQNCNYVVTIDSPLNVYDISVTTRIAKIFRKLHPVTLYFPSAQISLLLLKGFAGLGTFYSGLGTFYSSYSTQLCRKPLYCVSYKVAPVLFCSICN